jgi:predicted unusual protein kinase regulating ubiquinone biosynthesis (AarF/ABC1/UbiB family)
MTTERRIPASRLGRISRLGRLAGGIASGLVSEGARQVAQGRRPRFNDLLLTPANARRLRDRMSEMRGAAMKVGQLLSMDSGNLLPAEFSEVLKSLREGAHHMPMVQLANVLEESWGEGWEADFKRFHTTPGAAASIGQVHEAVLKDGRHIAVKIQYPGVRRSIDSDVANVATLFRLFRLLPEDIDIDHILDEARRQLHDEADYLKEAEALKQYTMFLDGDDRFRMPAVLDEMTTSTVLSMSYLTGDPIETVEQQADVVRNRVGTDLLELGIREVFNWGLVQTDPNFANYRYQQDTGVIELLDFGATRRYSEQKQQALRDLLAACSDGDDSDVQHAAFDVGYLGDDDPAAYRRAIIDLLRTATEPARAKQDYDFGCSDIAARVSDIVVDMRLNEKYGRMPPVEVLFLHRKLGGLYLLLNRLRVRAPVRELVRAAVNQLPVYPL